MKVIGINGSPRRDGNTAIVIQTAFAELEKHDIETELIQIGGNAVRGCTACMSCFKNKNKMCVLKDDLVNDYIRKMQEADGVILGSPVYFYDITAEMKALIDRAGLVSMANGNMFRHKVGAAVATQRRIGSPHATATMNHFFLSMQMFVVGAGGNMVIGNKIGEVKSDAEGMISMSALGANMALLIESLSGKR